MRNRSPDFLTLPSRILATFSLLAMVGSSIAWFQDPVWAMPAVAAVTLWWTVGFNVLLFMAAIQGVPQELYEAAALDGASSNQMFRYIAWPLVSSTLIPKIVRRSRAI